MDVSTALVIIDQQKGIDHPKLGARNNPEAESNMLALLSLWRRNGWLVIHVQHRSKQPDSVFWPHQSGYEFKDAFKPLSSEVHIVKQTPCAFTGTVLQELLNSHSLNSLVITGVATNNSVESSARTAGNLGFSVTVVADACFTFAKVDFNGILRSAEDVHAMSLANIHDEYANVCLTQELLSLVGC